MLFKQRFLPGLADGSITLTFRRWRKPQVKAGAPYRTPAGMLVVDAVGVIDDARITEREARAAGYASRDELLRELARWEGTTYRVRFHFAGADPRDALRRTTALSADEWRALEARLARLDAAARGGADDEAQHGPWTTRVLALIAERPGVRAGDLAAALGRERLAFKAEVRKLKALGLTESLDVGYRLSPRGRAVLRRLSRGRAAARRITKRDRSARAAR